MTRVAFIHGLNTYGDDDIHVGPLRFGKMYARWRGALAEHGIEMVGVDGIGAGSPEEQAVRVLEFLERLPGWNRDHEWHLIGQSVGGLTARVLATRREIGPVRTVVTIGTPHSGTLVAELGMSLAERRPILTRTIAALGYDTVKKQSTYRHFTREAMHAFNERYPLKSDTRFVSMLCELPREELSVPYRLLYDRLHPSAVGGTIPASDGFIWSESQRFGDARGPFAVDHFGAMGFFPHGSEARRQKARSEFARLVEAVASLVSK